MPAYMNGKTGAWYVQCYYSDIDGNRKHKVKRGFATKGEALAWETEFLACADGSMSMPFEAFVKRYSEDVRPRLKLNTWLTKEHIIRTKIVPFFGPKRMCDISPKDVVDWQNKMVGSYDDEGKPYSGTYLRTINNQLSAIFNHAVKYYGLGKSPAAPTIKIGERQGSEMKFWTKEQYLAFSEEVMDKPASFYVITSPKTPKSKRDVVMPEFLADELADFLGSIPEERRACRIFCFTKSYLHHEMKRGCAACGLEPIRIHDLRHSHVSLLIEMGFSAIAIADRLGHETYEMTLRYAHLFPSKQSDMAAALDQRRRP